MNLLGQLINRIPGSCLLISTLPDSASRTHVKALPGKLDIKRHTPSILSISASLAMSTSILEDLPGKLDIKRHSPIDKQNVFMRDDIYNIEHTDLEVRVAGVLLLYYNILTHIFVPDRLILRA